MTFHASLSTDNSALNSSGLYGQLTALNTDVQIRVTQCQLAGEIGDTYPGSNGVGTLSMVVSDPPTQSEIQAIADKLDELISALQR